MFVGKNEWRKERIKEGNIFWFPKLGLWISDSHYFFTLLLLRKNWRRKKVKTKEKSQTKVSSHLFSPPSHCLWSERIAGSVEVNFSFISNHPSTWRSFCSHSSDSCNFNKSCSMLISKTAWFMTQWHWHWVATESLLRLLVKKLMKPISTWREYLENSLTELWISLLENCILAGASAFGPSRTPDFRNRHLQGRWGCVGVMEEDALLRLILFFYIF